VQLCVCFYPGSQDMPPAYHRITVAAEQQGRPSPHTCIVLALQARALVIALSFHQWLEGIALGGFITTAGFGLLKGRSPGQWAV
jgi:hypothetical protein